MEHLWYVFVFWLNWILYWTTWCIWFWLWVEIEDCTTLLLLLAFLKHAVHFEVKSWIHWGVELINISLRLRISTRILDTRDTCFIDKRRPQNGEARLMSHRWSHNVSDLSINVVNSQMLVPDVFKWNDAAELAVLCLNVMLFFSNGAAHLIAWLIIIDTKWESHWLSCDKVWND